MNCGISILNTTDCNSRLVVEVGSPLAATVEVQSLGNCFAYPYGIESQASEAVEQLSRACEGDPITALFIEKIGCGEDCASHKTLGCYGKISDFHNLIAPGSAIRSFTDDLLDRFVQVGFEKQFAFRCGAHSECGQKIVAAVAQRHQARHDNPEVCAISRSKRMLDEVFGFPSVFVSAFAEHKIHNPVCHG